jgi:hypothetical protein
VPALHGSGVQWPTTIEVTMGGCTARIDVPITIALTDTTGSLHAFIERGSYGGLACVIQLDRRNLDLRFTQDPDRCD